MWTVVAAGSFGILGVLVGQVLGRRTGHRTWVRGRQWEACIDVLNAANAADDLAGMREAEAMARERQDIIVVDEEQREAFHNLLAAESAAWLATSGAVASSAEDLISSSYGYVLGPGRGQVDDADTRGRKRAAFIDQARKELGL